MERELFPSQTVKCDSFADDRNGMPELHSAVIDVTRSTVSFNWLWRKPRGLSTYTRT